MFSQFIKDDDPTEHCGLFLKAANVSRAHHTKEERPVYYIGAIVELPNRASNTNDNFIIYQSDVDHALRWLEAKPQDILGFWHTHPANSPSVPSQHDLDSIMLGDKDWWHCVYSCQEHTMTWFDYHDNIHTIGDSQHGLNIPRRSIRLKQQRASGDGMDGVQRSRRTR